MLTVWGRLDRVGDGLLHDQHWVQVTVSVGGSTTVRVRALVGKQAVIAREGTRIDVADLRTGEIIVISCRHGRNGFMEADSIEVRPEPVPAEPGRNNNGRNHPA